MKIKGRNLFFIIAIGIGLLVSFISSLGSKYLILFQGIFAIYFGIIILIIQKNKKPNLLSPDFRLRIVAYAAVLAGLLFLIKYFRY